LAAIPLIIHLINMMRHRRVKWAAMDFLLLSYKKQRNWIFLKQLLLLLLRMAIMVAAVAMLAGLDTADRLTAFLGGKTTHHYVLLDDSYSMADQGAGAPAFERANDVISIIANRAASEKTRQRMTLIRFSQATLGEPDQVGSGATDTRIDIAAEIVDAQFDQLLAEKRRTFDVTELSTGPQAALDMVRRLVAETEGEQSHVYLLSDFRQPDWRNPAEVRKQLGHLDKVESKLHLVRCVGQQAPNLAITHLAPADQTRAAGVPLYIVLTVKNFGPDPVQKVPVKVQSIYYDANEAAGADLGKSSGTVRDTSTVMIDRIDPGETASRRLQVFFPGPGKHVVAATLPEDAVSTDNRRYCAIEFPQDVPVLVIDDMASDQNDAYYLTAVFQPGERARTGIRPDLQPSSFLRDASPETLKAYSAIYLLNVPALDETAVDGLKRYVRAGGGLAVFLGPDSNLEFYRRLYEEGEGLFPVPLAPALTGDGVLPARVDPDVPDFHAIEHPVFAYLSGESNAYLAGATLERYYRVEDSFRPAPQSGVEIIASLYNGEPMAAARQYGSGRVVAFLTTAAPVWNSWARDDSFALMVLNLQSYLSAPGRADQPLFVGAPVDVQLDATIFQPGLSFFVPTRTATGLPAGSGSAGEGTRPRRRRIVTNAVPPKPDSAVLDAAIGRAEDGTSRNGETDFSGIYEAWLLRKDNKVETRRFAVNVQPQEGDVAVMESRGLVAALDPVEFELHDAADYQYAVTRKAGSNWTNVLLILLILLLLGEQAMAYSASYHPARGGSR
jgi:hypothetical protein